MPAVGPHDYSESRSSAVSAACLRLQQSSIQSCISVGDPNLRDHAQRHDAKTPVFDLFSVPPAVPDPILTSDFSPSDLSAIERSTQEIGRWLFEHLDTRRATFLNRDWWNERIMAWAMRDESV